MEVEKYGPPREKDIDVQVRIVAELIESRPPVIILAATDYNRFARLVERAVSVGIPVVTFDSGVNSDAPISFVATDNVEAGRKAGSELARLMGAPSSTRIAIVSHIQETATAIDREAGVRQALEGYDIAGTWFCDVDQDLAYRITRELLERPDIGGIVALNETTTLGVAEAVVDAGAAGRVYVVGFDNALMEMQYLERNVIQATVVQHPYDMGYLAMKTAYEHLAGRDVPRIIDTGSLLVTAENMFDPGYQETLFPFGED
jgi:ribose transport system substrate-binding protein